MNNKDTISVANPLPPESMDVLIVLGAIVLVALIVFFGVLLFRKDGKHPRKHHHRHHRKSYREQFQKTTSGIKELIRQHRRRRHREHRPINPTLAQTGGLPPIREADKPSPPPGPQP
jgi:FtsZ-interacting cell division protein ZipA